VRYIPPTYDYRLRAKNAHMCMMLAADYDVKM
jgi:hypothetical protein